MNYPRFPDWLIYFAATGAILVAAVSRQEHTDTPEPPPPGAERVPLGPDSPFDPATVIRTGVNRGQHRGAAFAVAEGGVWLTARSEVHGCERLALKVAEGRAVGAHLAEGGDGAIAVLRTQGGPPPLVIATGLEPRDGVRAFLIGFPKGAPGEASVMRMTTSELPRESRAQPAIPVQVWAETGRTTAMPGPLTGLVGAPVVGADHQVVGLVLRQEARHARFYSTGAAALNAAVRAANASPAPPAPAETATVENYGRVADDLRRSRQVAQVLCLVR